MFTEGPHGEVLDDSGEVVVPTPLEKNNQLVNGLEEDALNQFWTAGSLIQTLNHHYDVENILAKLRKSILPYFDYLDKNGVIGSEKIKADPKTNLESVAEYDRLVDEYNQIVSAENIDLEKLKSILDEACVLFGRNPKN